MSGLVGLNLVRFAGAGHFENGSAIFEAGDLLAVFCTNGSRAVVKKRPQDIFNPARRYVNRVVADRGNNFPLVCQDFFVILIIVN